MSNDKKISEEIRCEYHELMEIDKILKCLDQENANTHTSESIKDMALTLATVGWEHAIVIATHPERQTPYIQYGNKRAKAAKLAGFTHAPVILRDYETSDLAKFTNLGDNGHGQRSKIDLSIVNLQLETLDSSYPLSIIGIQNLAVDVADRYTEVEKKKEKNCPHCGEQI